MRAAQILEHGKPIRVGEVPDPVAGPHDVIIRVEACGVCRSDWPPGWETGNGLVFPLNFPLFQVMKLAG